MCLSNLCLISALTCLLWIDGTSSWVPTPLERAQILEYHLKLRESVQPPASNMKLLRYSMRLEDLAVRWAHRCIYEHPNTNIFQHYAETGQNIAIYNYYNPSFLEGACGWATEDRFYTYATHTCTDVCGHYTQMLWENTTEIGCAVHQCDDIMPGWRKPQYFMVCQYSPGGNIADERPYRSGKSCSGCSRNQACYRNQCVESGTHCGDIYPLLRFPDFSQRRLPKCQIDQHLHQIAYG